MTVCLSDTGGDLEMQERSIAVAANPHMLVCVLRELGSVLQDLGSCAAPLMHDSSTGQPPHTNTPHGQIWNGRSQGVQLSKCSFLSGIARIMDLLLCKAFIKYKI